MERQRPRIAAALPPGAQLAYDRLGAAVDSYAMAIGSQLLQEKEFGRDHEGRLTDRDDRLAIVTPYIAAAARPGLAALGRFLPGGIFAFVENIFGFGKGRYPAAVA